MLEIYEYKKYQYQDKTMSDILHIFLIEQLHEGVIG